MPLSASALRALQQDREPQLPYGSVLEQEPGRQVVACSDPAAIVPLSGRWQALSAAFNQADMPIHDVVHNILQANVDHRRGFGSWPGRTQRGWRR